MKQKHQNFMLAAMDQAHIAAKRGEVPVGAAIVNIKTNTIVALTSNRIIENNDPTSHAEILAIREACEKLQLTRLKDFSIYVTLEPCPMCAAAISLAQIKRLHIGAYDIKGGGVFHGPKIFDQPTCFHRPEISSGHFESEASTLLKSFFHSLR